MMKTLLRSKITWLALFILAVIAGGYGYQHYNKLPPEQQYRLQTLDNGDISLTVSANGTINPVSLVNVGTQVSGTVKKLYVDFNSKVKKGQILLELDNSLLAAQQKQSLASVESARASLELASASEARTRGLYAQEYVSRLELDTAVQVKKAAQASLKLSLAAVEKDTANLAYSVIRSPVSGVVVDRSVDVGQTVAASLQTPTLFKIAQDLAKMQIDANFAEADIGSIREGQAAHFTVDAFPSRSFQGRVQRVRLNPTTLQNVVTYDVVINVDNPEQILLPGMTAYVSIPVAERKAVLLVPNAALRFKPSNDEVPKTTDRTERSDTEKHQGYSGKVFVLKKGKLIPVKVSLGITDNRNTEIVGGELKAGDKVALGEAQTDNKSPSSASPPRRMF